jgi:4-cresol dehydrogenase (hydroxylating)
MTNTRIAMDLLAAVAAWSAQLGCDNVLSAEDAQRIYCLDTGATRRRVAGALTIRASGEVAQVMQVASRHQVPVYPISTGHNWGYGTAQPAVDGCVIVDLSALQRIIHFDAELGVVTVEPGVTQGMLADFLAAGAHPYMVPVTGAGPNCSLLGNALERGYGITPHGDHFAAITDLEAVLADGTTHRSVLRNLGGEDLARLFKWGLGPYTTGLFAQGAFGIVTKMSIVLARRPPSVKVCLFSLRMDDLVQPAIERVRHILSMLPGTVGAVNLMNRHRVLAMAAPYPREGLGADGLIPDELLRQMGREYQVQPWTGFITLYGSARMVRAAQHEIRHALRGVGSRVWFVDPGRAALLARLASWLPGSGGLRLARTARTLEQALELVAGRPNETTLPLAYWLNRRQAPEGPRDPARDGCGLIWFAPLVPMRQARVRAYLELLQSVLRQHGFEPLITLTSLNDRLFDSTVPLLFDRDDPASAERAHCCYRELLSKCAAEGFFPYRLGVAGFDALGGGGEAEAGQVPALHMRLRAALDPNDILAPGRYTAMELR